jgi:peptidoglycan-associated lipoprotein
MSMIKAFAAVAALMLAAACSSSSNPSQQTASATTSVAPGTVGDFRQNVGDRVYFDTDMSTVRDDGRATLDRQAEWLNKYTSYPVTIEAMRTSAAPASTTSRWVSVALLPYGNI